MMIRRKLITSLIGGLAFLAYAATADTWAEEPLTLERCIEVALTNNPGLRASQHDLKSAEAASSAARAERWPTLRGAASYFHHLDPQRMIPAGASSDPAVFGRDMTKADLVVTLPLLTGGRITSEIEAAEFLRQSAEGRLVRTQDELVFAVSSVFYAILAQRRAIEAVESSAKALKEHHRRVRELMESGKAARVDLLRTEVRLADLDQQLTRERNTLAIQHRLLANLMGVTEAGGPQTIKGELRTLSEKVDVPALVKTAIRERTDRSANLAALEAQKRRVEAAGAAHWPTVSLQGSYGERWAFDPTEELAGSENPRDIGLIGVVAEIPIFEGGRISAKVQEEREKVAAAEERLRKLDQQIQLEVETAALDLTAAARRVDAAKKAIDQARESLRIEREKYELGRGSIADVLDAQAAMLQTQTSMYRALADLNTAHARLCLAAGEGTF